ncbi:MAG: hypothetical protein EGR74_01615 [Ruminiclostridium sp.]|nr:hypothetical protein [Ruminiclostridium sp.]
MMQKVIKILLVIIGSIVVIIALITATLVLTGNIEIGFDDNGSFQVVMKNDNNDLDSYDRIIQSTLTTYPTDIFVYGEDCKFRKNVKFKQIDKLSEENLKSDKRYKVIVFNDLYDKTDLTDDDIAVLKKYVLEGDYALFYTGRKHMDAFIANGFATEQVIKENIGFALRHSGGTVIETGGLWDETSLEYYETENPELLGESIFIFIERIIRED